jgi:hypothetical protein
VNFNPRREKERSFPAQLVIFRLDDFHTTTLLEYINYVRQRKIALYTLPKRGKLVADFLIVVDETP